MFEFLKAIWKKQPGTDRGRQRAAFAEFGKGLACFSPSQREQALRHFRAAIALKPDEGVFHLRIAATLEALAQLEEALREYHEAIRLMPGDGGPFFCLGNLARSRGHTAGARENYAKASAPLIEALRDRAGRVRSAAAAALGRFGPQAVEPLIRTLGDEYFFARAHAAESLGLSETRGPSLPSRRQLRTSIPVFERPPPPSNRYEGSAVCRRQRLPGVKQRRTSKSWPTGRPFGR